MSSKSKITALMERVKFQIEKPRHKLHEKQSGAFGHGIPFLQATLFACILEDCLIQLRILAECNNELRIMKTNSEMGLLLALKFHVEHEKDTDNLDKIKYKDLGSNQYKLNKLFSDSKYCTDVLRQAYLDMALNRCFSSLSASIKTIEDRDQYLAKLTEEEASNKIARRQLTRQLRQQRNHIKSVIYDTNLTVEKLKCRVEDTELNSETRSRFVENWQRARTEQHVLTIFNKESGLTDAVHYFQERSDEEQRAHAEVELLVNIFINETITKVDDWMNKFTTDMEEQDLKIAKMKNKHQDAKQLRLEMEKTYATHEMLVKNWLQFKADRQEVRLYREKMTNSAIIVQAWWRGLLVRLQMGPYNLKMKPKAVPAEEKKKKKK